MVTMQHLLKFGSLGRIIHVSRFKDLLDLFVPREPKEQEVEVIPVDTNKITFRANLRMEGDLTIEFIVKNKGKLPLPQLDIRFTPKVEKFRKIFHESCAFIQRSIEPGDWEMITVTFWHSGATFVDIPNEIPYKVFDLKTRKQIYCSSDSFPLSSGYLFVYILIILIIIIIFYYYYLFCKQVFNKNNRMVYKEVH